MNRFDFTLDYLYSEGSVWVYSPYLGEWLENLETEADAQAWIDSGAAADRVRALESDREKALAAGDEPWW